MFAITEKKATLSLALIKGGANVSYVDEAGVTLLTEAAYLGLDDVVEALLRADADASVSNLEGITPLIAAASEGFTEIAANLIKSAQATINAKDKDGTNALMAACVRGHVNVVELLLANGVNVNAQNNDGHTALMFAYNGKNQIETLQVKYKEFVPSESDGSSQAMLEEALSIHRRVIALLIAHGADASIQV